MRWRPALAVLLAGGCNQVFGIEPTVNQGLDQDDDGIGDRFDNCPTRHNPDQGDQDNDDAGDVCDPCPAIEGSHDEDGDGRGDDCDSCPGMIDFQEDTDADAVGDACDFAGSGTERVVFDPFVTVHPRWQAGDIAWQTSGDAIAPIALLAPQDRGLRAATIRLDYEPFQITIGVLSYERWTAEDSFGIALIDDLGSEHVYCKASCPTPSSCRLVLKTADGLSDSLNLSPTPFLHLVFGAEPVDFGLDFRCGPDRALGLTGNLVGSRTLSIALFASPNIHLTYVDVLR